MKRFPLISIIILSYNGKEYVRECLNSVLKTSYPLLEVIVFDNKSNDGSQQLVKDIFPSVTLIESSVNLGFSLGNNFAAEKSKGDIIVLLNQDTYVDKNWLEEIMKAMESNEVGVVGCKIYYPNTKIIQSIGFNVHPAGYTLPIGGTEEDNGQYDEIDEVDYVAGTALAIKRPIMEKIGLLDPAYTYYEDTDLCFRVKEAGYKIIIAPRAIVYHFGSVSFGKNSLKHSYLAQKSRVKFVARHFYGLQLLKSLTLYDLKLMIDVAIKYLRGVLILQKEPVLKGSNSVSHKTRRVKVSLINFLAAKLLAYVFLFSS